MIKATGVLHRMGYRSGSWTYPIGSMYGIYIYANFGGILMVNVTIYSIHGSYGYWGLMLDIDWTSWTQLIAVETLAAMAHEDPWPVRWWIMILFRTPWNTNNSYPLVNEHRPWQIGLGRWVSIENWWFPGSMFIYQRVTHEISRKNSPHPTKSTEQSREIPPICSNSSFPFQKTPFKNGAPFNGPAFVFLEVNSRMPTSFRRPLGESIRWQLGCWRSWRCNDGRCWWKCWVKCW